MTTFCTFCTAPNSKICSVSVLCHVISHFDAFSGFKHFNFKILLKFHQHLLWILLFLVEIWTEARRFVLLCSTSNEEYFSFSHPALLEGVRARAGAFRRGKKGKTREQKGEDNFAGIAGNLRRLPENSVFIVFII